MDTVNQPPTSDLPLNANAAVVRVSRSTFTNECAASESNCLLWHVYGQNKSDIEGSRRSLQQPLLATVIQEMLLSLIQHRQPRTTHGATAEKEEKSHNNNNNNNNYNNNLTSKITAINIQKWVQCSMSQCTFLMRLFHRAIDQNATYPTVSAHVPSHMNLGWRSSFNPQGLMCCWPNRGSQNSLTLLGRLSTSFSSGFTGIFDHSSRSTFVKSDADVRQEVHAHLFHFNSSQRWSNGFEIRTRCRTASFFHKTPSSLSLRASLCAKVQAQWNRKGHPPTVGSTKRSKIAEFAEVFEFL